MSKAEVEVLLRAEIADLLHVSVAEVPLDAELFDLGFNSFMVAQLLGRFQQRTGVVLRLRDLFISPTIEALSTAIANRAET